MFTWNYAIKSFQVLLAAKDEICCFCLEDLQTDVHLFLQCPFARAIWFGSQLSIRPDRIQPQDLKELLKSCLNVSIRTQIRLFPYYILFG